MRRMIRTILLCLLIALCFRTGGFVAQNPYAGESKAYFSRLLSELTDLSDVRQSLSEARQLAEGLIPPLHSLLSQTISRIN